LEKGLEVEEVREDKKRKTNKWCVSIYQENKI
jgi:hypothetical protein